MNEGLDLFQNLMSIVNSTAGRNCSYSNLSTYIIIELHKDYKLKY